MTDVDATAGIVRATVEVALPLDEAFRVFTAEVGTWYVVDRHTVADHRRTVDIRFEPRVGGRFVDVYDAASGEGREMGRITVWEPPLRLAFVDARDTETEVAFAALPPAGGAAQYCPPPLSLQTNTFRAVARVRLDFAGPVRVSRQNVVRAPGNAARSALASPSRMRPT